MKCVSHIDADATSTCQRCGSGLCHKCATESLYKIDNKPLCKNCDHEVSVENNTYFKKFLIKKEIQLVIYLIALVGGIIAYLYYKSNGEDILNVVLIVIGLWTIGGFIGGFFNEKVPDTRSTKKQVKEAIEEADRHFRNFIVWVIITIIVGCFLPLSIIFTLIHIIGTKKDIKINREVMKACEAKL